MEKKHVVAALLMGKDSKSKSGSAENPASMVKALDTSEDPDPFQMLSDTDDPPPVKDSWGFHLLVNCSSMNEKMDSEKEIEKFYNELISELKMKKLTDFFCIKVHGEDGRGISAFQMITTSHISMHFDDDHRCGYLDIFSCKNFEPKIVVKMIEKYFKPKKIASKFVYRDAGLSRKSKSK